MWEIRSRDFAIFFYPIHRLHLIASHRACRSVIRLPVDRLNVVYVIRVFSGRFTHRGLKIKNVPGEEEEGGIFYRLGPVWRSLRDKRGDLRLFSPNLHNSIAVI